MKTKLRNHALMVLLAVLLAVIPIIGVGPSPDGALTATGTVQAAPVLTKSELKGRQMAALEVLISLDDEEWAIFEAMSKLSPDEWEHLGRVLEQNGATAADLPAALWIPSITDTYNKVLEVWSKVGSIWSKVSNLQTNVGGLVTTATDIWGVIEDIEERALTLLSEGGQMVAETIEDGLAAIVELRVGLAAWQSSGGPNTMRDHLMLFIFGVEGDDNNPGVTDVAIRLATLVPWALGMEETTRLMVEGLGDGPDDIGFRDLLDLVPDALLYLLSKPLDRIGDWQTIPKTMQDFLPDPGELIICDLLLVVPDLGSGASAVKYIAQATGSVFELIKSYVPDDLSISIVGEGITLTAHPARMIIGTIVTVINMISQGADTLSAKIGACETNKFRADLKNRLDLDFSDIDQSFTYLNVYLDQSFTDIDVRLDQQDGAVSDFSDREIEEALLRGDMIVSLYLPAVHGGILEHVIDMVELRISQSENAGLDVGNAGAFLDSAMDDYQAGLFKGTYSALCQAYQQLVAHASPGKGNGP